MTLRLLPGAPVDRVTEALSQASNGADNARSGDAMQVYEAYVRWVYNTTVSLGSFIGSEDFERLVLTPRHWALQSADPSQLNTTLALQLELERAAKAFGAARDDLQAQLALWQVSEEHEHILVPDTNLFLHHEQEFHEVPWEDIIMAGPYEPIHVVVPLIVIDELDRAKRRHETRSRARTALKQLDRMALRPGQPHALRMSSQDGPITVRLLPEEQGHVRLPHPDAELVDVVRGLRDLVNRDITIVTFDTCMVVRARAAGLSHRKPEEVLV